MTGIELFYQEAQKREYIIGQTDVSAGEGNGDFMISDRKGNSSKQNYKKIAEIYGLLTFYHFDQQDAINQIFEMIEHTMVSEKINDQHSL